MQTLPVTLIIPHWNRIQELRTCIDSLSKLTAQPKQVLVVDDGSPNQLEVKKEFPNNKVPQRFL